MVKPERGDPLKDITSSRGRGLRGKKVVLCVTGSVASIEVPALARELMRHGAEVHAVMSEAAERLVRPETLQWATGNPVVRRLTGETEHVKLAGEWEGRAHLVLVAPCTANTISKLALGIDDTPVTTVASMALGGRIPLVICPAAHEPMYRNPAVQANVRSLVERGVVFVGPTSEEGKAKMASVGEIVEAAIKVFSKQDLAGRRVVVSGGPTAEFIDPVRVITNLSSGKMGLALAKEASRRGAEVFYVYGGELAPPVGIRSARVRTTAEMRKAVLGELKNGQSDAFISAAAPSDFAPVKPAPRKIPTASGRLNLVLEPTPKIVEEVRRRWPRIFLVAFKAETTPTDSALRVAATKFRAKLRADVVVANDVSEGRGFGSDRNSVLILGRKKAFSLKRRPKEEIASRVMDEVVEEMGKHRVG
ncbi:MAG: bifunctional phosphopantothenoylcysteine decarboxylase/phosphopantothenate--cysteine ligase CoaBC [Thaumarchaeota archaeon]|nr:bifunctional phosphopantothenoylcysteine decarboxylase/phosphopantothenate--cysteine ligase CoaBC [Nitrososphaerota archaeon]